MHRDDDPIEKLASDVTDALREPMELTRNNRRILPCLPLLIGTSRCNGDVTTKRWWSWEIRLTWIRTQ
jgi:hypothetical protein